MRNRLTAKTLLAESQADGLFPGDVGNEERKKFYHKVDEYDNGASEFKEGWDTPVKYDIKDERDKDTNIGIMKTANAYRTAKQAITLATMLLGDKAPEKEIRAQAREFMALGYRGICNSIRRWAATEPSCPECGNQPCTCKADEEAPKEEAPAETATAPAETATAPAEASEVPADAPAETATAPAENTPATDAPVENGEAPALEIDIPEAQPDGPTDLGDGSMNDVAADPELQALFSDEEPAEDGEASDETATAPASQTASKKAGIKHLGGQPHLAASQKSAIDELASCWSGLTVRSL